MGLIESNKALARRYLDATSSMPYTADDFSFDGRVVLVTGGSRGLGRAFSRCFASHGASVVINSLGSADDAHPELSAAEVTRGEIERMGGRAAVIDAAASEAQRIIEFCLQEYGRLDAIVHSAGILRDASIGKLTQEDWRTVQSVHLEAAYQLSHAAWPLFRVQGYGRLLFLGSAAGIYGNFGQASYAAAKLGLLGLARTLAVEGSAYGIHCNCIAPVAATRMNERVLDPALRSRFTVDAIAPLAAFLCHERCEESGSLFEAAGGWFAKVRFQRSSGVVLDPGSLSIAGIARDWSSICDFGSAEAPASLAESIELVARRTAKQRHNHPEE